MGRCQLLQLKHGESNPIDCIFDSVFNFWCFYLNENWEVQSSSDSDTISIQVDKLEASALHGVCSFILSEMFLYENRSCHLITLSRKPTYIFENMLNWKNSLACFVKHKLHHDRLNIYYSHDLLKKHRKRKNKEPAKKYKSSALHKTTEPILWIPTTTHTATKTNVLT